MSSEKLREALSTVLYNSTVNNSGRQKAFDSWALADAVLSVIDPILEAKDAEIAYLKRAWAATEALENLNEDGYERTLSDLRAQVEKKDAEITELVGCCDRLIAEIAALRAQRAEALRQRNEALGELATLRARLETLEQNLADALSIQVNVLDDARNAALEEAASMVEMVWFGGDVSEYAADIRALISKG